MNQVKLKEAYKRFWRWMKEDPELEGFMWELINAHSALSAYVNCFPDDELSVEAKHQMLLEISTVAKHLSDISVKEVMGG